MEQNVKQGGKDILDHSLYLSLGREILHCIGRMPGGGRRYWCDRFC